MAHTPRRPQSPARTTLGHTQACIECQRLQPISEFPAVAKAAFGVGTTCKGCRRAYAKARYHRLKACGDTCVTTRHKRRLLTPEQFQARLEAQGGACAVCQSQRKLYVDYAYKTGKPRGLLCSKCMRLMAWAKDDSAMLRRAEAFLMVWKRVGPVKDNTWELREPAPAPVEVSVN